MRVETIVFGDVWEAAVEVTSTAAGWSYSTWLSCRTQESRRAGERENRQLNDDIQSSYL